MTNLDRITGSMGTRMLKVLLEELRSLKPWGEQTSEEQQQTLERVQGGIDDVIRGHVKDLLSGNLARVPGVLKSVVAANGVRAVVDVADGISQMETGDLHDLVDRCGKSCVIVLAGPEEHQVAIDQFYGEVMPDQPDLALDAVCICEHPESKHSAEEGCSECVCEVFEDAGREPDRTTSPFALDKLTAGTCDNKHPSPVCADPNCWQSPDTTVGSEDDDD